jgi:mycothiol synthase
MLGRVIEHARELGAEQLDLWAYNDSAASREIAGMFAFREMRRLLHMHRHPGEPPHLEAPEGARVRPFQAGVEDATLVELNNRVFDWHPEQGQWTLEDFRARTRQPWFDPRDILMLEVGGELAGFCWLKVEERGTEGRIGEVYVIGTAPEHQGRGLGRYLLSEALQHLSTRSVNAVAVYVEETNTAGARLYGSFEFHHHHVDVCYTLALGEAGASVTRMDEAATGSLSAPR